MGEQELKLLYFIVATVSVFYYICLWVNTYNINQNTKESQSNLRISTLVKPDGSEGYRLYQIYINYLKGDNKQEALKAGRLYYRYVRSGRMSTHDEIAMANDLACMKNIN